MKKGLTLFGLGLVVLFCVAAQAAPPAEAGVAVVASTGSTFNWMDVVKGLVSGAIAAAIGYFKAQDLQKLEIMKLVKTVIFGGIVGSIAGWRGTSLPEAEKWTAMIGVSFAFTYAWDIIVRRVTQPVVSKVIARRAAKALQQQQPPPPAGK